MVPLDERKKYWHIEGNDVDNDSSGKKLQAQLNWGETSNYKFYVKGMNVLVKHFENVYCIDAQGTNAFKTGMLHSFFSFLYLFKFNYMLLVLMMILHILWQTYFFLGILPLI